MEAVELNKLAISMGKVIIMLSDLEPKIKNGNDIYKHKDDFCVLAYTCRVGILDRMERYSWMQPQVKIRIPTGIISLRTETINSGLYLTVGKLKELVSFDVVTEKYVESILNKQDIFYQYDELLPDNFKQGL